GGSKMGEGGPAKGPEGEAGNPNKPKTAEKAQTLMPRSKPKEKSSDAGKMVKNAAPQRKVIDSNKAKSVGLLGAFAKSGVQKDLKNLLDAGEGQEGQGGFDEFGKAVKGFRGEGVGGKTIGIDGPSTKGLGRGYHGNGIGEGISGPGRLGMKGEHAISIISEN